MTLDGGRQTVTELPSVVCRPPSNQETNDFQKPVPQR